MNDIPTPPISQPVRAQRWRRRALATVKFAVVAAILAFVWSTLRAAVADLGQRELRLQAGPALLAAAVYALSQLVLGVFWRRVVVDLGHPAPLGPTLVAYFISQLGKYVPGKATVLLVRTERLLNAAKRRGDPRAERHSSVAAIAASVFYESLVLMAVGAALAAGLLLWAPAVAEGWPWLAPLLVLVAVGLGLPAAPPVFGWVVARATKLAPGSVAAPPRLPWRVVGQGAFASTVAWGLLGVSLALSARAVGVEAPLTWGWLPVWVLAAALPNVAGFLSLLPGGLVVREAASLLVLTPVLGEADALAATIAARVVGVATEVVVCVSLVVGGALRRPPPTDPPTHPPGAPPSEAT